MEFTDEEIRQELGRLGYKQVPDDKLLEFKKDLLKLIQSERSKTTSLNSSLDDKHQDDPKHEHNVTHNSNQWAKPVYREDWQYAGRDKSRPATATGSASRKSNATKSFGLFEQPLDNLDLKGYCARHPHEKNNSSCTMDDSCCCCCCCSFDISETDMKKLKRKTARSHSSCELVEDTNSETDAAGIYELYERVRNLAMRDCECNRGGATSADEEPPYRIHGVNRCPSIIKSGEPPHTRNLVKTLPWKRHEMYVRMWKAQPVVGEDHRKSLRKETQAKMMQKHEVKTERKIFKPNKYVPPPENPRYKLRWEVRRANSQYEVPSTVSSWQYKALDSSQ